MVAAVFGLVGVLVGGLITWGIERATEKRREEADLRQAKRLISEELHTVWVHLSLMAEEGTAPRALSPDDHARFLPTTTWREHRSVLARSATFGDDDWIGLSTMLHNVETVRLTMFGKSGAKLTVEEITRTGEMTEMAAQFYEALTGQRPEAD